MPCNFTRLWKAGGSHVCVLIAVAYVAYVGRVVEDPLLLLLLGLVSQLSVLMFGGCSCLCCSEGAEGWLQHPVCCQQQVLVVHRVAAGISGAAICCSCKLWGAGVLHHPRKNGAHLC